MAVQMPHCQKNSSKVSFSAIVSVLSVLFYCAGFFRVELVLNEQQKRTIELEDVVEEFKSILAKDRNVNLYENKIQGKFVSFESHLQYLCAHYSFSFAS